VPTRAVADEDAARLGHVLLVALGHLRLDADSGLGRSGQGRRDAVLALRGHGDDGGAHLDGVALGDQQLADDARIGRGQLDERLRRLDLDDDLVDLDGITRGDLPRDDLRFGEAFADIRQRELGRAHARSS
jgi:hypothetical protein